MAETNGNQKLRVQRTIFDLDSFAEVTLAKEIDFVPVTSIPDALTRLENKSDKLIAIVNEGLRAEARRVAGGDPRDWRSLNDDGDVNGAFAGTVADPKAVNALVLTLAKTVFGYNSDLAKDQRNAAKESAMNMIASTPAIKEGLKKSAALKVEEADGDEGTANA